MTLKSKIVCTLILLLPILSQAQYPGSPANFKTSQGMAIFVDFITADYQLVFDSKTKRLESVSTIQFENNAEGLPLFDLVTQPTSIVLDGEIVSDLSIKTPDGASVLRQIQKVIKPGLHILQITAPVNNGIKFLKDGVSAAFWFSDLTDRSYLEAYLPANLEYDQYQMDFLIEFKDLTNQKIYSNGQVVSIDAQTFKIEFPKTYTASSIYFHTAPIGRYFERSFAFSSIDGRSIPVLAYTQDRSINLSELEITIKKNLAKLESAYGPYPHASLTVFMAGSGGMEYCGATMSDLWALNHELTHSWFARGSLLPANGNAGWLDEAITTWSDTGSPKLSDINSLKSNMAGHSMYQRFTDMDAYTKGKNFMSYLHYKLTPMGGLQPFLKELTLTSAFTPLTTEQFIIKISQYYKEDLTPLFIKHVYDKTALPRPRGPQSPQQTHMKMTIPEMSIYL